jgi:hypothetical protein
MTADCDILQLGMLLAPFLTKKLVCRCRTRYDFVQLGAEKSPSSCHQAHSPMFSVQLAANIMDVVCAMFCFLSAVTAMAGAKYTVSLAVGAVGGLAMFVVRSLVGCIR